MMCLLHERKVNPHHTAPFLCDLINMDNTLIDLELLRRLSFVSRLTRSRTHSRTHSLTNSRTHELTNSRTSEDTNSRTRANVPVHTQAPRTMSPFRCSRVRNKHSATTACSHSRAQTGSRKHKARSPSFNRSPHLASTSSPPPRLPQHPLSISLAARGSVAHAMYVM